MIVSVPSLNQEPACIEPPETVTEAPSPTVRPSTVPPQTVTLPLQKDDPFYTVEGMMRAVPHFYEKTTSAASLDGTITLGSDYQQK